MNPIRFRLLAILLAALVTPVLIALPSSLLAKDRCQISVDTILASRQATGVDPQLQRHIRELQSMFNYTSYRLLSSKTLNLGEGESGQVALPDARQLTITPHKIRGSRADLALQMTKGGRSVFQTQIQLLNRGSLFVGGPNYQNGNLIFKISGSY